LSYYAVVTYTMMTE